MAARLPLLELELLVLLSLSCVCDDDSGSDIWKVSSMVDCARTRSEATFISGGDLDQAREVGELPISLMCGGERSDAGQCSHAGGSGGGV